MSAPGGVVLAGFAAGAAGAAAAAAHTFATQGGFGTGGWKAKSPGDPNDRGEWVKDTEKEIKAELLQVTMSGNENSVWKQLAAAFAIANNDELTAHLTGLEKTDTRVKKFVDKLHIGHVNDCRFIAIAREEADKNCYFFQEAADEREMLGGINGKLQLEDRFRRAYDDMLVALRCVGKSDTVLNPGGAAEVAIFTAAKTKIFDHQRAAARMNEDIRAKAEKEAKRQSAAYWKRSRHREKETGIAGYGNREWDAAHPLSDYLDQQGGATPTPEEVADTSEDILNVPLALFIKSQRRDRADNAATDGNSSIEVMNKLLGVSEEDRAKIRGNVAMMEKDLKTTLGEADQDLFEKASFGEKVAMWESMWERREQTNGANGLYRTWGRAQRAQMSSP